MNQDEIVEGFRLLGLDEKINETYDDISEFAYKIANKPELDKESKLILSNSTENDDA